MPEFPFHFQDSKDFCGPTCLVMMLQSQMESRNLPFDFPRQSTLLNLIKSKCQTDCSYFISSPEGLEAVANDQLQLRGATDLTYSIYPPQIAGGGAPDFAAEIRACLDHTGAPVFALIESGGHWVLLYGRAEGFFNVRWPTPFSDSDDALRVHDSGCTLCPETADGVMSESAFLSYLLPVLNATAGRWISQTVLLTPRTAAFGGAPPGPAAVPAGPAQSTPPTPPMEAPPEESAAEGTAGAEGAPAQAQAETIPQAPEVQRAPAAPLPPDEALNLVRIHLPKFGRLFKHHSGRLPDAVIGPPILVEHIDSPERAYYIVPVIPKGGVPGKARPIILAQVSAYGRQELERAEAATAKGSDFSSPLWVFGLMAADLLKDKLAISIEKSDGRQLTPTGRLVWKSCSESPSPFQPFHELTDGENILWMDVFGSVHKTLTSTKGGR